ncbi:MAG: DUF1572 domain-containing protein [Acidobacteriia bacterium]|nr:DUF1572 domain-containing protein [Terriglobia bacterium]
MEETLDRLFLDFSARKLQQLAERIETCLGKLTEEQVWARSSENENAIGNLVLHLNGNVRQWIVSGIGGAPDIRQRDREFAARGGVPIAELAARLRATVAEAQTALGGVTRAQLAERVAIQQYEMSVLEAIYHVVEHFSEHTGQVIFATKMLTASDLGFYRHLRTQAAHGERTP